LAGSAVVIAGSRLLVDGAVGTAERLGVPTLVVGLTVVAIGTSLPELVTAITSARKAVADLAIGNVLGANIANLSLIVGVAAVIADVPMTAADQRFNFPAMLALFGLTVWILRSGHRVTRGEGRLLLVLYAGYLGAVVWLAT
jgi:cation:H+ antiporter